MVYWITGLAGAGKTTVGKKLYEILKQKKDNTVFLDGDVLRTVFSNLDYSLEGRRNIAYSYSRLCKLLDDQGIDVIICTISMFEEVRKWNRDNIQNYREIFLDVSYVELEQRNKKGLYKGAVASLPLNVVGVNVDAEFPVNPDLTIENYGEITPDKALEIIMDYFNYL